MKMAQIQGSSIAVLLLATSMVALSSAYTVVLQNPDLWNNVQDLDLEEHDFYQREKRSLQPGAPNFPNAPGGQNPNQAGPWEINPDIKRTDDGNTQAGIGIKHKGPGHEIDAGWSKVVRGPNRAKPTYHVTGTWRFRRSLQPGAPNFPNAPGGQNPNQVGPWEVNPDIKRTDDGNTQAGIGIKHKGPGHEIDAGWSKVVRGPNRAKPTYHVTGTWRFRRSLQPGAPNFPNAPGGQNPNQVGPWEINPDIKRTDDGNTQAGIGIKHKGPGHEIDAGWSKVVRGPNRAKPTYHVTGTWRFRRSLQPGAPNFPNAPGGQNPNQVGPWEINPDIKRTDDGNTQAGIGIKHKGPGHEIDAGWSKVVRGPNRAKPTYHVTGTWRFRRSLQPGAPNFPNAPGGQNPNQVGPWEINPDIKRTDDGNTQAGIGIKHKGPGHEIDAGWSKVVRGPNRAKPTYHVTGTWRFRRSLQPGAPNFPNAPGGQNPNQAGPWEINPDIKRTDDGNTQAGIGIKHKGPGHEIDAGWSKVVRGPNRAKPTYHVTGSFKF